MKTMSDLLSRVAATSVLAALLATATSCVSPLGTLMKADRSAHLAANSRVEHDQKDALELAAVGDRLRDGALPDYAAAQDAYRMALRLEPRNPYLHVASATAYIRQAADELKQSRPSIWQPLGNPAAARNAHRYFQRATSACEAALKINPNHFGAHFALAEAYALMERYNDAASKLDEIEQKQLIPARQQAAFYAWRGYVRGQQGKRAGSLEDLEHAVGTGRPYVFAEYASALANPPDVCETVSSCGAVASFAPVVGEPPPRAAARPESPPPVASARPSTTSHPPATSSFTFLPGVRPLESVPEETPPTTSTTESRSEGFRGDTTQVVETMPNPWAVGAANWWGAAVVGAGCGLIPAVVDDGELFPSSYESSLYGGDDDYNLFFTGLGIGQLIGGTAATWASAPNTIAPWVVAGIDLVGLGATALVLDKGLAAPIVTSSLTLITSSVAAGVATSVSTGE